MKKFNFAIVGATGMVGRNFIKVIEEYNMPIGELYLFASKNSAGKKLTCCGKEYTVIELTHDSPKTYRADIALFSAGGDISLEYAPLFAQSGAVVIDNSSAWRMHEDVPLIVPEVNPHAICGYKKKNIIANPNCSTIQAMLVLKPILDAYGIKRVVYSTYQAVSGAGQAGVKDLENGINGEPPKKFVHEIAFNCIPHIDSFLENGYTKEEMKMVNETRKILEVPNMRVTATTVRVPVYNGHSESINIETERSFDIEKVKDLLASAPGVVLQDDPKNNIYPMPVNASGKDEVFVGRIRRDESVENGINLFVVADNIRKGAASNAVQIAKLVMEMLK